MLRFREWLEENPIVGYVLVGFLVLGVLGFAYVRLSKKTEAEELAQFIIVKDAETGETWQIPLGAIERNLNGRDMPIDLKEGLPNPNTGKPTGFPEKDWEKIVKRVTDDRMATSTSKP